MPKFIGAMSWSTSPANSGIACRTTTRPDAYQPLSTADRKKQLSWTGVVSVLQSISPGLRIVSPLVVSYHWYRKPLDRCRPLTACSVALISDRACGRLTRPRSAAATTAHRYTPMFEADV